MSEQISDQELAEWETDLAAGYTVDTRLGIAFLRLLERCRVAEQERDLRRLESLIRAHGVTAVREALSR